MSIGTLRAIAVTSTSIAFCISLIMSAIAAPVVARGGANTVLLDTLVNNQVTACSTRPIEGGTTNGYAKEAESFTVTRRAKVTSIVLALSVQSATPASIQVEIVAANPWDGTDPANPSGSGSWDNIPDESAIIGGATQATVSVVAQPCGQPEIVTATFSKPIPVSAGTTYWVVLQNPPTQTNTFQWTTGTTFTTSSTDAIYVVDENGSRWLSYLPGTFRPSAMRVLGRQP